MRKHYLHDGINGEFQRVLKLNKYASQQLDLQSSEKLDYLHLLESIQEVVLIFLR